MDHKYKTQEYKTHRRRLRRITLWLRLRKKVAQQFSSLSLVAMLWTSAHNPSLSFTISWSLFKLMSIEKVMPSNHLVLSSPSPLALQLAQFMVFPNIRVFSNELVLHIRWPNSVTSASASVIPVNIQGWFPLGLNSLILLQSKEVFSNTTIQKHQFFSIQPSLWSNFHIHIYWKNHSFEN